MLLLIFVLAIVTSATQGLDGRFEHSGPVKRFRFLVSTT